LGNVVYVIPPYVTREEELRNLMAVLGEGIDVATRD
jgi:adenosylmethionine-8-amino-7-oxononanoate aminotransferase